MQSNFHNAQYSICMHIPSQLKDYIFRKRTIHCLSSLRRRTISLSSKNVLVTLIQNLHSSEVTNIVVPFKSMRTFQPNIHVGLFFLYEYLVCTKFRRRHAIFLSLSLKKSILFSIDKSQRFFSKIYEFRLYIHHSKICVIVKTIAKEPHTII